MPAKPHRHQAIIVDIDGTMALRGDRSPYDLTRVHEDRPNMPVIKAVTLLRASYKIIFISGRQATARQATERWLDIQFPFPWEALLMRRTNDGRPDAGVKWELYQECIEPFYRVEFVLDDRDSVVKMWRETAKLPCFQVAPGGF